MQPLAGLALILFIAFVVSTDRRSIKPRVVVWGLSLQFLFALIVLKTTAGRVGFQVLGDKIRQLLGYSVAGSSLVFGPLGDRSVWTRIVTATLGPEGAQYSVIFAFQVLPTIIFIAALFAILYYFGVMQVVVRLFAIVMNRVMGASGAESLNVAASIFMGQTEAPLTIRPYLPEMTLSELMTVMTSGMAHISGGIMAAYVAFGIEPAHLLTAVIMTAPGTLMMAKMFVPETAVPATLGTVRLEIEKKDVNVIDAAGRGTSEGLQLAVNVGAMLISFMALVALANVERVHCVFPARSAERHSRSTVLYDCDVCVMRVRKLLVNWHSDWWHWRSRAHTTRRPRAIRIACDVRRHAGELHYGDHCRVLALSRAAHGLSRIARLF